MKSNRRFFLKTSGMAGLSLSLSGFSDNGVEECSLPAELPSGLQDTSGIAPLNRLPRMVQEYFVEKVRQIERDAERRRSLIRSKIDAEAYVHEVREKIQKCFGTWPEKNPLNARTTGILKRDSYNIEKLIFDSRPDFPVTANLYVPKARKMPMPGVIGSCGHSTPGKSTPYNQSFAQGLARQGYVVLLFDPIGQGERLQYLTEDLKPLRGAGVTEHLYAGNQMVLTGEAFSAWRTWDAIRAIDYLTSRPEVDIKHIGMTGASGGGTMTTWVCGSDPRLTMAAPCCFVTTFLRNLENELVADNEQYPPRALSLGLDISDFIAAMAPKPVILLGEEKDYFDIRGLQESFKRLKTLYGFLGDENNIQLFIGQNYHSYSKEGREAMYNWFNKITGISDLKSEPSLTIEEEDILWCTPHGQAGESHPSTVFSFTRQKAIEYKNNRKSLKLEVLKQALINVLRLPSFDEVPEFRILRPVGNRHYPKQNYGTYMVETEPGIDIIVYRLDDNVLLSRPPSGQGKALLYVSHLSADDELRKEAFLRDIINNEPDSAVFACDVRGIGESKPNTCGDNFFFAYGNDYFYAGQSIMLDYPYTGQKTFDLLRIINLLKSCGHEEIHIVGNGLGTVPATFAALLSDTVSRVTLKNALKSYSDIAENEEYNWPLSSLLPDVLKDFDLPDCYRALESKNLRQIEPWNAKAGK